MNVIDKNQDTTIISKKVECVYRHLPRSKMFVFQGETSTPAIPSEGKQKCLNQSNRHRCRNISIYDNNDIAKSLSTSQDVYYKGLSLIPTWDSKFVNRLLQLKQKENHGSTDSNCNFPRTTNNTITEIKNSCICISNTISNDLNQETCEVKTEGRRGNNYSESYREMGKGRNNASDYLSRAASERMQQLSSKFRKETNMSLRPDDEVKDDEDYSSFNNSRALLETMIQKSKKSIMGSQRVIPTLPGYIIIEIIGSYVVHRSVWNSLASLNRETLAISRKFKQLRRPWPSIRWRATTNISRTLPYHPFPRGPHRRRRIARGAIQTSARPRCVAFGKDYLCCGTDRGDVLVRRVYGNGVTKILLGHKGCINSVKCYGDWLASAGDDLETRIWNVTTMSCEVILKGHTSSITSIAILPLHQNDVTDIHGIHDDRKASNSSTSLCSLLVATAGLDGDVHLYAIYSEGNKIVSSKHFATFAVEYHPNPVYSIVLYEKDGQRSLISGGCDGQLRLWDVDAAAVGCIEEFHHDFNAETRSNASATNVHDTICIDQYDGEIKSIALSRDKERIAVAFGRTICHSNLSCRTPGSNNFLHHHDHNHRRRRRLEDQRRVRNQGNDDPEEKSGNDSKEDRWKVLRGHSGDIRCIDFSPDGKSIASACSDGFIRLWKLGEGTWKRKWKGHNGFIVSSLAVSPDGQSLLSAGSDGTIAIESLFS